MVKKYDVRASCFTTEGFTGSCIHSTSKFVMEFFFLGKKKTILAAYGMSFVSGVVKKKKC